MAIGVGVLVVMFVCARLNRHIPGGLIGLVGSTALVAALGLQAHGVAVLGTVQSGAPHLGLTGLSWSTLGSLAPLAAVVALVVVTQTAATTAPSPIRAATTLTPAVTSSASARAACSAGLVGSFPVDASPPRTGAVVRAGGRTQAGALGAALVILLLIPVANVLKDVPLATLAAVLIYVAIRLFKPADLRAIARFDLFEFGLAVVTLLAVVLIGVEQGIGVAVGLAILDRIRLSARPQLHDLGRLPGTTSWAPLSAEPSATNCPASSSCSSRRRSGTPTQRTSATRWSRHSAASRTRRSSCSMHSGCPMWTSPDHGNSATSSTRATAPMSPSVSLEPGTTWRTCCDEAA